MPDTKDFHGMKNILLDNDDWMVVDPLDYDAFVYYAPENDKSEWNKYKNGDTYFVIDKNKEPIQTSVIHKTQDNKIEYYGNEVQKHRGLTRFEFESDLPDEVKLVIDNIVGQSDVYKLLTRIVNGEPVSSRWMENVDESVYDFKYTPKAPFKSKIVLKFDDDEYIKLFDPSEDDMWYYNAITSYYDSYEWDDGYQATEDFGEGYFFSYFNEENLKKIKEILSIIEPSSVSLETDEQKSEAGKKLLDMFGNEIDNIISDYTTEHNQCKTRGFNSMIKNDFCNPFQNYGIFTKYCLTEYFTSVGMLLSLYDTMGDKTLTIKELLFRIGSDMNITGWGDYIYEMDCEDFDQESFDSYTSTNLDRIIEKLEDESQYEDIHAYGDIYRRLDVKFKVNNRYKTKSGREFFYRGINVKNNRILIQVFKKGGGLEDRSYTEEEFNNFLVSPELFEGFIRIN